MFDFDIGGAINESHSYVLMSAMLKVDDVCDVNSQRLNDRVMRPPIQPMYRQHVLLFVLYSIPQVG